MEYYKIRNHLTDNVLIEGTMHNCHGDDTFRKI